MHSRQVPPKVAKVETFPRLALKSSSGSVHMLTELVPLAEYKSCNTGQRLVKSVCLTGGYAGKEYRNDLKEFEQFDGVLELSNAELV